MRSRLCPLARSAVAAFAGLALAACSGGGDSPITIDAPTDGDADAPVIDAPIVDAPWIDSGVEDPIACGTGTPIHPLPPSGNATGMTLSDQAGNIASTTCRGRGAEVAYLFTVDHAVTMVASTESAATTLDTVLYVRTTCQEPSTELACNDDHVANTGRSRLVVQLPAGTYYLIVDGRDVGSGGAYALSVRFFEAQGAPCASPTECAPGFTCRPIPPSTQATCQPPVCSDGRDDDGDGDTDYPADPGCTSPADDSEEDLCPGPAADCPACADEIDNDNDGLVDWPMDLGCVAASSDTEEACLPEVDPTTPIAGATTTGTTAGAGNQFEPVCMPGGTGAPDRVHFLYVRRPLATLVVDTEGSGTFDTVLSIKDAQCGADVACDDDSGTNNLSRITLANVAAATYTVVVDGWSGSNGAYALNVAGTYAASAACDPAAPYFRCPTGFACSGAAGAETCAPTACNDTVDADGDGRPGYPSDPGCTGIGDLTEADECPSGPTCPACANGLDDDSDGAIDYPLDSGCLAASTASESCASVDPLRSFTSDVTGQTTATLANDVDLSCGTDGRDEIWHLAVPHPLAELRVDTIGSALDVVVGVKRSSCAATDLRCDDNSAGAGDALIVMTGVTAGDYFLVVDDRNTTFGNTYNLNVAGTYPDGGACNPTSPLFACRTGFTCAGATPICTPTACNDTVDADGDGDPGFPSDPGCTSVDDTTEADTCPAGPGCPACGNGVDDDGDTRIDWPLDPGCTSASRTSETDCVGEDDPLVPVTGPVATGTTVGAMNDFTPSCSTSGTRTAPDRVHVLTLTVPVATLVLSTDGSAFDTTLTFSDATCAPVLACDDDLGAGNNSLITRTNVAPGVYSLIVDAFSTASGPYTLNVRGTLAPNASCTDPLVAAGVLSCPTGQTCQAGTCAP